MEQVREHAYWCDLEENHLGPCLRKTVEQLSPFLEGIGWGKTAFSQWCNRKTYWDYLTNELICWSFSLNAYEYWILGSGRAHSSFQSIADRNYAKVW